MMLPICCILLPKWMGNPGEFLGQSWESRGKVLGACWANVGKFLGKGWGPDSQIYPRSFPAFALDFPRISQSSPRMFPGFSQQHTIPWEMSANSWEKHGARIPKIFLRFPYVFPVIFP